MVVVVLQKLILENIGTFDKEFETIIRLYLIVDIVVRLD